MWDELKKLKTDKVLKGVRNAEWGQQHLEAEYQLTGVGYRMDSQLQVWSTKGLLLTFLTRSPIALEMSMCTTPNRCSLFDWCVCALLSCAPFTIEQLEDDRIQYATFWTSCVVCLLVKDAERRTHPCPPRPRAT